MQRRVSFADGKQDARGQQTQAVRRAGSWHEGSSDEIQIQKTIVKVELADHEKLAFDAAMKARAMKENMRQKKATLAISEAKLDQNAISAHDDRKSTEPRPFADSPPNAISWISDLLHLSNSGRSLFP